MEGAWGGIPKNDLLRFKAATDDYYTAMAGDIPGRPVMRVFGGAGRASRELRGYAALHGITIIDLEHWPAPLLAAPRLRWPQRQQPVPPPGDRRALAWLSRPLQKALQPQLAGAFLVPPPPSASRIAAALDLHDHWSGRLWDAADADDHWFEELRAWTGTAA